MRSVDAVCLRANWDYHASPEKFMAWLERLQQKGVRVLNKPDLVRWNFDKRYLLELREKLVDGPAATRGGSASAAGGDAARLHIPDVHVVDPRNTGAITSLMAELGWEQAVLKSVSGQSGYHCHLIRRDQPVQWQEAAAAIPTAVALLQAFQSDITTYSETVFVFFGGEFSHAVKRVVAKGQWQANARYGAVPEVCAPSAAIIQQARNVLQAAVPIGTPPPVYARVDGIVTPPSDGEGGGECLTLMELELIEPALYMDLATTCDSSVDAAAKFAETLEAALLGSASSDLKEQ